MQTSSAACGAFERWVVPAVMVHPSMRELIEPFEPTTEQFTDRRGGDRCGCVGQPARRLDPPRHRQVPHPVNPAFSVRGIDLPAVPSVGDTRSASSTVIPTLMIARAVDRRGLRGTNATRVAPAPQAAGRSDQPIPSGRRGAERRYPLWRALTALLPPPLRSAASRLLLDAPSDVARRADGKRPIH
jgi:hypothetical protein